MIRFYHIHIFVFQTLFFPSKFGFTDASCRQDLDQFGAIDPYLILKVSVVYDNTRMRPALGYGKVKGVSFYALVVN